MNSNFLERSIHNQKIRIGPAFRRLHLVLNSLINKLNSNRVLQRIRPLNLSPKQKNQFKIHTHKKRKNQPLKRLLKVPKIINNRPISNMQSSTNNTQNNIRLLRLHPLSNQQIQPGRINRILHKALRLQQRNQILNSGAKFAPNRQLLQSDNEILARLLSRLAPRKTMAELRVSELVQATAGGHAEVSPHVFAGPEVELLYGARTGLESLLGIFAGDARCDYVTPGLGFMVGHVEVDDVVAPWVFAVQQSYVFDFVEGEAHRNLEIWGKLEWVGGGGKGDYL